MTSGVPRAIADKKAVGEVAFDKYAVKGAYHWAELFGPLHRRNAYTIGRYEQVLSALKAHCLPANSRVLDVGCGDAALTGLIATRCKAHVAGVDTTALSIELARKEFSKRSLFGEFQIIDGYEYPYADASFEAVVCSDVIEHVREPRRLLGEMWRVLKPGGVAIVTTPIRFTEAPLDPLHVEEWFPQQFRDLCTDALRVPVDVELSHPVAWAEIYAAPTPIFGRMARLWVNVLAAMGRNVFLEKGKFRAFSTQTMIARKPGVAAP